MKKIFGILIGFFVLVLSLDVSANHRGVFDYFYTGDYSPNGAFFGSNPFNPDFMERCQLMPLLPTFPQNIRVNARISTADNSVNWIARIRDPANRNTLMTFDLPDDGIKTLHDVSSEFQPFTIDKLRRKYLVCVSPQGGRATVVGAVGYDKRAFSGNSFLTTESWVRFGNRWSNTTALYGDYSIWLEFKSNY